MSDFFLDYDEELTIHDGGHLSHWDQDGKIQFVTFRLADSLPKSKRVEIDALKEDFIKRYPQPWPKSVKREYNRMISPRIERLLDNGYGECWFRLPDVRKIVSDSIYYGDGKRYEVMAFVIMPNHVHLLFRPFSEEDLHSILKDIKSFTSSQINKLVKRKGTLWQEESHDRMVRNERHLYNCIQYIINNPVNLPSTDYELYVNEKWLEALRRGEE